MSNSEEGQEHVSHPPPIPRRGQPSSRPPLTSMFGQMKTGRRVLVVLLAWVVGYLAYFWFVRRVVVGTGQVLVVMKKDGSRSLSGDQIIVPRPPAREAFSSDADYQKAYNQWDAQYGDCNGILEQVYPEGTYFCFSPFDYEREVIDVANTAIVPNGKVGVVVRKFGSPLPLGQVLADPAKYERGPLRILLQPARYNQYANPYAYEIRHVD